MLLTTGPNQPFIYLLGFDDASNKLLLVEQQLLLLPRHRRLRPRHKSRHQDQDQGEEHQGEEGVKVVVRRNALPQSANWSLK